MSRTCLIPILVLGACATEPYELPGAPQVWKGSGAFDQSTPWHRDEESGIAVRTQTLGPYTLGEPVRVRLEIRNFGIRPVVFDSQGLAHEPYSVTTSGGKTVPYVNRQIFSTFQSFVVVSPDETKTAPLIDLADLFALLEPGQYVFQFSGLYKWSLDTEPPVGEGPPGSVLSGVPESPPLRVSLDPGPLTLRDQLLQRLLPIVPSDWHLHQVTSDSGCRLVFRSSEVRSYSLAEISFGCATPRQDGMELLGTSRWGKIYLGSPTVWGKRERDPEDERAERDLTMNLLPDLKRDIRRALDIKP